MRSDSCGDSCNEKRLLATLVIETMAALRRFLLKSNDVGKHAFFPIQASHLE